MTLLAVLDIGSITAHLQIVKTPPPVRPRLRPVRTFKVATLLGDTIEPDERLTPDGIDRVCRAVSTALDAARLHGVDQIYAFVTAAIRDAPNRDEILDRIHITCGIRPNFLTGPQEAQLTYLAVHHRCKRPDEPLLNLDIGGGTMEIALGQGAEPDLALSLPLGAARLTRRFLDTDPPSSSDVQLLRQYVRDCLHEPATRIHAAGPARRVIATSRTFTQLARLAAAPRQGRPSSLTRDDLHTWIPRLACMTTAQRADLPGVSTPRAHQILAGAIVAYETMHALNIAKVTVCRWALREGLILHQFTAPTEPEGLLSFQPLQPAPRADHGESEKTASVLWTAAAG